MGRSGEGKRMGNQGRSVWMAGLAPGTHLELGWEEVSEGREHWRRSLGGVVSLVSESVDHSSEVSESSISSSESAP